MLQGEIPRDFRSRTKPLPAPPVQPLGVKPRRAQRVVDRPGNAAGDQDRNTEETTVGKDYDALGSKQCDRRQQRNQVIATIGGLGHVRNPNPNQIQPEDKGQTRAEHDPGERQGG